MAQLDDLKAALGKVGAGVDAVDTKLDTVRDGISGVAAEVAALIERLGQLPSSPDLAEAITQAEGIATHLEAVSGEAQSASDALGAIPKAPPQA